MRRHTVLLVALLPLVLGGCSRAFYRQDADAETYAAVDERFIDRRWVLPPATIVAPPQSRLYDPYSPDYPPLPPDDPAAHQYMVMANGMRGYKHWHKDGDASSIESPYWRDFLQLDNGTLVLTPDRSMELALLHSREYQSRMEDVYLVALALTLDRFEFDLHWFFRNNTTYTHAGNSSFPFESNTLATNTNAGFTKAFAAGGQLLVDFANSFVWEYNGPNEQTVSSNLLINFLQPLLRGAGRDVRMEGLTQSERELLYAVRDFARFRKQFYVDITTTQGGYLDLLLQVQSIRNLEANLKAQEQNLRMHRASYETKRLPLIAVDQAFLGYQQSRLALLQAQTGLETALDAYKATLGLPPGIPVRLDDALLKPFELTDPSVTTLQDEVEKLLAEYRQLDAAPPLEKLKEGYNRLKGLNARAEQIGAMVHEELERWKKDLADSKPAADDERALRQRDHQNALDKYLLETRKDLAELRETLDKAAPALAEDKRDDGWQALLKNARLENDLVAQLFELQVQVRVFLIKLTPIPYELEPATRYALANRLDLMNVRGRVVDAWRQIAVTANALQSDLNVVTNANIRTEADASNPFDLSARASSYSVGLQFDGPLNRQQERNIYRTSLVNYQRSRRAYMQQEDAIVQAIRLDLRQLENERLNFDIARQSLVIAARTVESARVRLRQAKADDTVSTQDVLNALNALLAAKNTVIGSWINYESGRIQLLLDMEGLQLDERGMYSDEHQLRVEDLFGPGTGPGDCVN